MVRGVKRSRALTLVALLMSCGGSKPPPASPPPIATAEPAAAKPPPVMPAVGASYDAALAEVKRLSALADQDPLLAPWTGPQGGVPPWDKPKLDAFPKAFELGIALM